MFHYENYRRTYNLLESFIHYYYCYYYYPLKFINNNVLIILFYSKTKARKPFHTISIESGIELSMVARIVDSFLSELIARHSFRLTSNLDFFTPKLKMYNTKLREKILSRNEEIPFVAMDTSCFLDGTRIQICKPSGPRFLEREMYSKKDEYHCLQFQCVTGIDGMIMDLFGGYAGSRHDWHIYQRSLFNQRFADAQLNELFQYKSYSDKGYHQSTHGHAAYPIYANTPEWMRNCNNIMSPKRIGVEWMGFS